MHRLAGVLCARRSPASRKIVVPGRTRRKLPRSKANNKCRGDQGGRLKMPASDLFASLRFWLRFWLKFWLPRHRNVLVAARGLDQMAAGREREVIAGHQHAVGCGAIEQFF